VRTSRRSIGTKVAAFTAAGLLVAGMTACGSDDDTDTPTDDDTDTPVDSILGGDTVPMDTTVTS
jgi:hypothetical protein